MARRFVINLDGAEATAVMHDKEMPKTCDAMWNLLPIEGVRSIHANWANREIMLHLTGKYLVRLPQEGPETTGPTAPGDIRYFYRAPQMSRGVQKAYDAQFSRELSEWAIFYGQPSGGEGDPIRSRPKQPGLSVHMLFATFEEIPDDFLLKCYKERTRGLQPISVRRLE
ncbi:MAG: DUF3830 family protein [archaeon]